MAQRGASSTRSRFPRPATTSTRRARPPRATSAISAARCTDQPRPPRITRTTSARGTSSRSTRAAAIPAAATWCPVKPCPRRRRGCSGPGGASGRVHARVLASPALLGELDERQPRAPPPLFSALYNAHADIVVSGHDHVYERYAQQDPTGAATTDGVRQFVAGTGGESLFTMLTNPPNLQCSTRTTSACWC